MKSNLFIINLLSKLLFLLLLTSYISLYSKEVKSAPNFTFRNLKHEKTNFKKFCKNSTTMVIFWTHCCSKEEIPILNDLYLKYNKKNLKFLAISLDRGSGISSAQNFYKRKKIEADLIFDTDGKIYRKFNGSFTKPVCFIIDKNFKIAFRHDGHAPKEFYEKALQKYLK